MHEIVRKLSLIYSILRAVYDTDEGYYDDQIILFIST